MIGTSSAIALLTAVPIEPEELSTFSSAADTRSRSTTAPSAATTGSFLATFLISVTACLMRVMAGCDFQPKARLRKRALNSHAWPSAFAIAVLRQRPVIVHPRRRGGRRHAMRDEGRTDYFAQRSASAISCSAKGATRTRASSLHVPRTTHRPASRLNASRVRAIGSTSHTYATPSRA